MYPIPEFNDKQLNRLSEFCANVSILIIATFVLPNVFGIDKLNSNQLKLGLILTGGLLLASMFLIKNNGNTNFLSNCSNNLISHIYFGCPYSLEKGKRIFQKS